MVAAEEVRERAEMRARLRIDFILMGVLLVLVNLVRKVVVVKLVCCLLLCRVVVARCKSIPSTYHMRLLIHFRKVPESALHSIPGTPGTHEAVTEMEISGRCLSRTTNAIAQSACQSRPRA